MKVFSYIAAGLLSVFVATSASAQTLYPQITLSSLKAITTTESRGDELYVAVTVYPSKGQSHHFQVPAYPTHWLSKYLDKVTDVKLWGEELDEGASVNVIMALVEADMPPWNADDLIGEVQVKLHNDHGKLLQEWSIPGRSKMVGEQTESGEHSAQFEFKGDGGQYFAVFSTSSGTKPAK